MGWVEQHCALTDSTRLCVDPREKCAGEQTGKMKFLNRAEVHRKEVGSAKRIGAEEPRVETHLEKWFGFN